MPVEKNFPGDLAAARNPVAACAGQGGPPDEDRGLPNLIAGFWADPAPGCSPSLGSTILLLRPTRIDGPPGHAPGPGDHPRPWREGPAARVGDRPSAGAVATGG